MKKSKNNSLFMKNFKIALPKSFEIDLIEKFGNLEEKGFHH